jgi:hypothetical protein
MHVSCGQRWQLEERGWTEGGTVICPLSRVPRQPSAHSDGRWAIGGFQVGCRGGSRF